MGGTGVRILAVDDEEAMREVLKSRLEALEHTVAVAASIGEAEDRLEGDPVDLLLSDVVLPDGSGLDLLQRVKKRWPDLPVLLMTAHGTVDSAVQAMKEGAEDFLTKPLDYGQLQTLIEAAVGRSRDRDRLRQLRSDLDEEVKGPGGLIGKTARMLEVYRQIRDAAATDAAVLITGESGCGKELTARALHELSPRSKAPFVAINTAAIPRELVESELFGHEKGAFTGAATQRAGCFELAHEGTLFLDEVAEMPIELQPKLLRVLEDGRVRRLGSAREVAFDVRVIAATNQDPETAVDTQNLRRDLLYRLNVFQIRLPPLRERLDDLELLSQHFVQRLNDKHDTEVEGLSADALSRLRGYDWPGNVRELRNIVERAVVVAKEGWIEPQHLPPYLRDGATAAEVTSDPDAIRLPVGTTIEEAEKALILRTLDETGQNKSEAARQLGVDVKTIRNKLKRWGLS